MNQSINIPRSQMDYDPYEYYERLITFNGTSWNSKLNLSSFLSGLGTYEDPYILANFNFSNTESGELIILEISNSNDYILIQKCNFEASASKYYDGTIGFLISSSQYIEVRNCTFSMLGRDTIDLNNVSKSSFDSCIFQNMEYGYFDIHSCENLTIQNNQFLRAAGINIRSANHTIIKNNIFIGSPYCGISLSSLSYNCQIISNIISQTTTGIFLGGSKSRYGNSPWTYYGVQNCLISLNLIQNCIETGIDISYASQTDLYKNTIRYCGDIGISLDESFYTNIMSNTLKYMGQYGINVSESKDTVINDNKFEGIKIANVNGVPFQIRYNYTVDQRIVMYLSFSIASISVIFVGIVLIKVFNTNKDSNPTANSSYLRQELGNNRILP